MRKILISCMAFLGMVMFSCEDYLSVDRYFNDMLTIDTVWTKRNYTEGWLANVYRNMYGVNMEIANKNNTAFNYASDDLIYGDDLYPGGERKCQEYQNCEYHSNHQLGENRWGKLYEGIRKASIFLANVDKCKELNGATELNDLKGQARFLRAYYYYMLMKQYGPVCILPEDGLDIDLSYADLAVSRSHYDTCVNYVSEQLIKAAHELRFNRSASDFGKPTKGAALALRAKVLIYAASPLYNPRPGEENPLYTLRNYEGKELISSEYSDEKWARAALAAREVIYLNGSGGMGETPHGMYQIHTVPFDPDTSIPVPSNVPQGDFPEGAGDIDPFQSYAQLFNGEISAGLNREFIWARWDPGTVNDIVRHTMPVSLNGWNTIAVTASQFQDYYMATGQDIYESQANPIDPDYVYTDQGFTSHANEADYVGAQVHKMFVGREPRFYASVAFPGTLWENKNSDKTEYKDQQRWYYKGDLDGKTAADPRLFLRTGVAMKKYYNPQDTFDPDKSQQKQTKVLSFIRYADVLLWYAEAMNEMEPGKVYTIAEDDRYIPEETTITREEAEMRMAIQPVRFRAGLPDFADALYLPANKDQFRTALQRERKLELFAEAQRYFDVRRWKIAPQVESQPVMGLNVEMTNSAKEEFHQLVPSDMPKVWLDKMYLWPLPQNELRRNAKLTQNPGW